MWKKQEAKLEYRVKNASEPESVKEEDREPKVEKKKRRRNNKKRHRNKNTNDLVNSQDDQNKVSQLCHLSNF